MKNIFIVALFCFSQWVFAIDIVPCSEKWVPIKMPGFSGSTKSSLLKKVQIAKLINPSNDQVSTYDKSFEMGKYRFVRNGNQWDIYRKNDEGKYEAKKISGQFLIDTDQNIYAEAMSTGELTIRKVTAGLENEIKVFFTPEKIAIKNMKNNTNLFEYKNCKTNEKSQNNEQSKTKTPTSQIGK
jgi:hypothetical protein